MMNPGSPASAAGDVGGYPSKRARLSSPDHGGRGGGVDSSGSGGDGIAGAGKMGSPVSVDEGFLEAMGPDATGHGGDAGLAAAMAAAAGGKAGQSSSFRNVSACNRCRLRKNRCDQRLPGCASCEKVNVKCVGYDPITKREIPRSYVYYLESRVNYLEKVLQDNNIPYASAEDLDPGSRPGPDPTASQIPSADGAPAYNGKDAAVTQKKSPQEVEWNKKKHESEKLNKLVSNIGSVSVQGASDSRYLGSTSGISFARVVFAAVKSSVSGTNSEKSGIRPSRPPATSKAAVGSGGTSMRDSFFGLHTKPTIKQAPFPDKVVGRRLMDYYFEHANPQIPILHRGEFMSMFELAYAEGNARVRTPRELYMLNMVFAIGSGIFLGDSGSGEGKENKGPDKEKTKRTTAGKQSQPEEYHASAIVHLEYCLSLPSSADRVDGFGGGLEELQAVLLLAGFALLRPVAPGLWYIIGVAVRLAVDLGLHYEDGKDIEVGLEDGLSNNILRDESDAATAQRERSARERGRREWIRDFRRRLWWCTYSFDRLVSTCVGRPFGITDQVVTTEFPSLLDDKYITPTGFQDPPGGAAVPSYKYAAYHYFRLRLLQSEILQVLQHQQAQIARAGGVNQRNPFMHTTLPSPFLYKFDSFRSWRIDIDKRLWQWKTSAPTKRETGVAFSLEFLELNYWQCVIMLYRQSLSVPPMFEGEFNTSDEVGSPSVHNVELTEDEDLVFLKVAEAGQKVLRLYRQLHRMHLVNYTFLATHHLFMAGISFLYAIWHSPIVRSQLTMDEVDFTILAATSVLGDLIEKCPPAEACRDAFDRMSKATVQMCMSTTGFSSSAQGLDSRRHSQQIQANRAQEQRRDGRVGSDYFVVNNGKSQFKTNQTSNTSRPKPQFDMGLNDLLGMGSQNQPTPVQSPQPLFRSVSQNSISQSSTSESILKGDFDYAKSNVRVSGGQIKNESSGVQSLRSPSEYTLSPHQPSLDNASIDPSLLPSARYPTSSLTPSTNTMPPSQSPYSNLYPHLQFPFPNVPGMDFLQDNSFENDGGMGNGGNGELNGDLGFGLGFDGLNHDFSEGGSGGLDLFEGFFFGGTGNF